MPDAENPPVRGWWAEYVLSNVGGIPSAEQFGNAVASSFQPVFASGIPTAEAFGTPALVFWQTIAPTSIESTEAFGGSALNPGDIGILVQQIGSEEAFGTPSVSVGTVTLAPPGVLSGEEFGTAALTPGPVGVAPGGIASAEVFGEPRTVHIIGPQAGIASEEAFGPIQLNLSVVAAGIASAEGFGTPNVVGPPQAIQPTGIASLEAFGGSDLDPGPVTVLPQGIASGAAFGTAVLSVGPVSIAVSGITSGEAFGTAKVNQFITPTGIVSQEAFGAVNLGMRASANGIASAEAFGTPTVERAAVPLTVVGYNTVLGSSITIPAHLPGDLIILAVAQTGVSAAPTKPTASGTVPAWATIDTTGAAGGLHTASFVATASTTTSGTWGGADAMAVVVLRSAFAVGGHAVSANIGTNFTAPAVTLSRTDGSSVLLHFYTTSSLTGAWPAAPSGYTKQSSVGSLNTKGAEILTKDITTSDGSVAVAAGGGFSVWQAASIEIRAY